MTQRNIDKLPTGLLVKGKWDTLEVWLDGIKLDIKPSQKVHLKSNEFAWGYGGSGPSQLALAILHKYMGPVDALAWYVDFKFAEIGRWPQSDVCIVLNLRHCVQQIFDKHKNRA